MPSSRMIAATAAAISASSRPSNCGAALHYRDAAAEAPEHLPELHADVAAAQHQQVLGQGVKLHDAGGVQVRHPIQAVQSRFRGCGHRH